MVPEYFSQIHKTKVWHQMVDTNTKVQQLNHIIHNLIGKHVFLFPITPGVIGMYFNRLNAKIKESSNDI